MSDETKKAAPSNDSAAADYVQQQLEGARVSLGRTKMASIIIILAVLAYMTFITKGILGHLEPKAAAETAKNVLVLQMNAHSEGIAESLKERIPTMMAELPEIVLNRLPVIRKNIEERTDAQIRNYAKLTAQNLEPQFEEFLTKHKDDINSFLDASQDLDALREDLNVDMEALLTGFLKAHNDGEESLLEKLEHSRTLLNNIADHTERLANDPNLNDREKQTRRAVAVLLAKSNFDLYSSTRDSSEDPDDDQDDDNK